MEEGETNKIHSDDNRGGTNNDFIIILEGPFVFLRQRLVLRVSARLVEIDTAKEGHDRHDGAQDGAKDHR